MIEQSLYDVFPEYDIGYQPIFDEDDEPDEVAQAWLDASKVDLSDAYSRYNETHSSKIERAELYHSQFVEIAFMMPTHDGVGLSNFSFEGRRHMRRIYDSPAHKILLKCARQVEKSTFLGNKAITLSCLVPGHRSLYVSPSATQSKTFSADRLKEPIETSEILRAYFPATKTQNIFEKKSSNWSTITQSYAFLNADRCVTGDTRVHFVDGSVTSLAKIHQSPQDYLGKLVWSVDPAGSRKLVTGVLTEVVDQGVRPIFDVHLQGGVELHCTENQPLLTWDGWRLLEELTLDDWVAVPSKLPHGPGLCTPVEEFRLVGYLIGDGSVTTTNATALHNGNNRILDDFRRCAEVLGAPLGRLQDSNRKHWVHSQTKRQWIGGGRAGYKKRLRQLGVIGTQHDTKRVPEEFFKGDKVQITHFLNALFSTDGWASVSKQRQFEIGYSSNSKGLLVDIKQLLLRFGIQCCISKQKKPSTPNAKGGYVLSIRHSQHVLTFCREISIFGKEEAVELVREEASKVGIVKQDHDRIPLSYAALRGYLKATYGISTHTAWVKYKIQLRPDCRRDSIGRQLLRKIGLKLNDALLCAYADSDIGWAQIEEIAQNGEEQTFDLSIQGFANYLSDGLFVHNTRGIPAYLLEIDEIQDILYDNIPVIEQCTSHAPEMWRTFLYSGTPKTLDNTIEFYWSGYVKDQSMSTQGEWVVPCTHCGSTVKGGRGRFWNILGERNIGNNGLICERCGGSISPQHEDATWANMRNDGIFESYRVSQLMVPWKPWKEILLDYERYPRDKFYNEVLGISYDSGLRPLTMQHIKECCNEEVLMHGDHLESYRSLAYGQPIFMGIDWGTGENSYTVITMATYIGNMFRVFYMHRCTGQETEPDEQLELIMELITDFNVKLIGVDYGGGHYPNNYLVRRVGPQRLHRYHYMARCKKKVEWDPRRILWKTHRTDVMSDVFNLIRRKQVQFPNWEEFKNPYAQDMCNIFGEYNEKLAMIQYGHSPDKPDDSFHSLVYCVLVSILVHPRSDITSPRREEPGTGPVHGSGYSGPLDQG